MIDQGSSLQKTSRYINTMDNYHTDKIPNNNDTSSSQEEEEITTTTPTTATGGYMWRFSSGLVTSTAGVLSGAVGLGVGGVKWVANKGITAGGVVVDTTKNIAYKVPVPSVSMSMLSRKDKKE